jgi:transposase InsO family protein
MVWRHHSYRLDEWLCGLPGHYLAITLDIYTRMIRGWSLGLDMSEVLIQESLAKALSTGHVPEIHHSDRVLSIMLMGTVWLFHHWTHT